jgi:serine/threonine-protein kinase
LNQRVAIKFLLPAAVGNPQIIERFAREARAAVQIQSEHVARVIDVGTLPTGSPYMVMEFLEGTDLAEAIEKGGAMPVAQAVSYVLQACEALAEAHALGIVHRDLKPANLFLARRAGRDSIVKVLDFGISKTNEKGPSGLTQTSAVMGSPFYMAPEQMMSSKDVDPRADIWALGIILYELLTGAPPFVADTMAEIVFMVTQRDAPPLVTKRADVPPELAEAIARCMLREPAQRYANVAKLAAALAPFGPPRSDISVERISRVLGASVPPSGGEAHAPHRMHATASTWANSQAGMRRPTKASLAIVLAVGACVLVLGSAILWRALRTRDAAPVTAPSVASALPSSPPANSSTAPGSSVVAALAPLPEPSAAPHPAASASAPAPVTLRTAPARPHGPSPAPSAAPAASPPPPPAANHGMSMGMKE